MSVSDMELRYGRIVAALLTLAEAQERVLARVEPLPAEDVSLRDAAGRVTAEAAKAAIDLPPFASSAMDGYAVRAADLPGSLAVVGHAAAGRPADDALGSGEAISISTGGVVPDGADSVVPIEYVVQHDNTIQVDTSLAAGTHVRPRGGDAAAGTTVVGAGVRLGAAELGADEIFWRVAIKPGKPVSFGTRGATLVFGLPGNPVSSLVGCELFVKPALRALQGLRDPLPHFEPGRLATPLRRNAARDELVRARSRLDRDGVVLEPLSGQESHMIVHSAAADALVHVPRGEGELEAGAPVSWLRLDVA